MNSKEILAQLISFDTTSHKSNLDLINFVAGLLRFNKIEPVLIQDAEERKANLYATIGPDDQGGVMLSGHTDVVPVEGQNWQKPPFKLTEEGGKLFGRGTADMKGFVACALDAMIKASSRALKSPLHLALSYDEEIGCVGVHSLIHMLDQAPIRPAMCIVGEPTNLAVATGHKGKTGLRAICKGVEGHSALAPMAYNAIHLGVDLTNILRTMQNEIEQTNLRDQDYDVPYTTVHVGKFNGGVALNIVPNHCELLFEIRNISADNPATVLAQIESRIEEVLRTARLHSPDVDIRIETFNSYPGLDTPTNAEVVAFVKSLTGANGTIKVAFGTEGGLFSQELGIPTVICGPGSMAQGHKPDEFVEIEQIDRCDEMLGNLVKRLELGL